MKSLFIPSVTKIHGLDTQQLIKFLRFRHQRPEVYRNTCEINSLLFLKYYFLRQDKAIALFIMPCYMLHTLLTNLATNL